MSIDLTLRAIHILAVVAYLGGGLMLHLSIRQALRLIPPGQAAIVGAQVGKDFTITSWVSLAAWGLTGYWMLFRIGLVASSPVTLFISPGFLNTSRGQGLFIMIASWYVLLISASIITFVLRPRLAKKLPPEASADEVAKTADRLNAAAQWVDRLAIANLVLAAVGFLAGVLLR